MPCRAVRRDLGSWPAAREDRNPSRQQRSAPAAVEIGGYYVGKERTVRVMRNITMCVMKRSILTVGKGLDKAVNVMKIFTGYVIFLFMVLLFLQVIMRFVFNNPIYGIDEAVTAMMIWSMCLGWCTVYWDNEHAILEFIMKKMPKWFRRIMFNLTNLLILVISYVYIPAAYTLFNMQKKMPPVGGLPFCKAYYYALPVLVMGIIMFVLCLYKTIAFFITGDESICVPEEKEGGGVLD